MERLKFCGNLIADVSLFLFFKVNYVILCHKHYFSKINSHKSDNIYFYSIGNQNA